MVSGTRPQPSASERCQAAISRRNRPRGKSHSGRSPRIGLYTASIVTSSSVASTSSVALLLHGNRPFTVRAPRVRTSIASVAAITRGAPRGRWRAGRRGSTSLGSPHIGQVGRPARCSVWACATKVAACARVMAKRAEAGSPGVSCSSSTASLATTMMRSLGLVVADAERADRPGRLDGLEQGLGGAGGGAPPAVRASSPAR